MEVGKNQNMSSNKCVYKTIMTLKPNQLQVTTGRSKNKKMQSLIGYSKLHTINEMLRSFDLENNHENLEEYKDNPFHYVLQSTA
jgi:hypothetical protein